MLMSASERLPAPGRKILAQIHKFRSSLPDCRMVGSSAPLLLRRRLHARFAQEPRRFLRWRGVDVKAGTPLETSDLRQFRDDFDMPVIVVIDLFPDWRRVNHEIVSRFV